MGSTKTIAILHSILILSLITGGCDKSTDPEPDPLGTSWILVDAWSSSDINGLVWGDTLAVAVGADGVVHTSSDGVNWEQQSPAILYSLYDVTWTGSRFVATGFGGTVATSTDGITWFIRDVPTETLLRNVAGNESHMLASGSSDFLLSSSNGTDWFAHSSGIGIRFEDILLDDTLWLACGDSGMTATSADGFIWTRRPGDLTEECRLLSLTATAAGYFAVGTREPIGGGSGQSFVYSSPDGVNWTLAATLNGIVLRDIAWSGSGLVAVGKRAISFGDGPESIMLSSANGVSWQEQPCEAPGELTQVAVHGGVITACGPDGYVIAGTSPDELEIVRSGARIQNVIYDGSTFIGVTNHGTLFTSPNGLTWEENHSFVATYFSRILYSEGKYVMLGGSDGEARSIFFSQDGHSWTKVWEPVGGEIFDMVRGNGQFVGVGEYGHAFLSDDGQNWTRISAVGAVDLRSIAFSGKTYLALGDSTVHLSNDGLTWSDHDIAAPEGSVIRQLIWADGRFRAVGYRIPQVGDPYNCFFSSDDGYNWTSKNLTGFNIAADDLIWTGARYFLFGRFGTLVTSVDGETWEVIDTGTESALNGMAVSSRRLVLSGSDGTILRSER